LKSVLLFDLGGVIFEDVFSGGEKIFTKKLNIDYNEFKKLYVKTDLPDYSKGIINDDIRWKFFADELGQKKYDIKFFIHLYLSSYSLIENSKMFIEKVKNIYSQEFDLGILSDQPTSVVKHLKKEYPEIFSLFNKKYTFISSEVGLSKRDKNLEFFKYVFKKINLDSNKILYIDDSKLHLQNALKVGIPGFHFDIKNQLIDSLFVELEKKLK